MSVFAWLPRRICLQRPVGLLGVGALLLFSTPSLAAPYVTKYTHTSGEITCGGCGSGLACLSQCDNCMAKVRFACDGTTRVSGETPVAVCCMGCSDMKCLPDLACDESKKYLDGVAIAYESTCPPPGTVPGDGRGQNGLS